MRVALGQMAVDPFSRAANQRHACETILAAANLNPIPDVLCLPGCCDGGSPGPRSRTVTAAMADTFVEVLALRAREMGLPLVFGFSETDGERRYDSAAWCDADGDLHHKHRRIMLRPEEHEFLSRGTALQAVLTVFGTIGVLVGDDAWNASLTAALRAMGCAMLLMPLCVDNLADRQGTLQETARRCGLWIVAVNSASPAGRGGGSVIIDPRGRAHAALGTGEELACFEIEIGSAG